MRFALFTLAGLGVLFGALSFSALDNKSGNTPSAKFPSHEFVSQEKTLPLTYKLQVSGKDGSCTVVKRGTVEAKRAGLDLKGGCAHLMPRLANARYWHEGETGEVIFATAEGRPVVEFFPADGVAYQSLNPVSPLIALTMK